MALDKPGAPIGAKKKLVAPAGSKSLVRLRTLAVRTLAQVLNSTQSLDQSMFEEISRNNAQTLPEFDRAWIFEICSGVLRFKGRIDYIIDTYALKKKPTGALRRYLMTAVFQLLEQDVASALVVSETVDAIRLGEGDFPSKFANAILRKVADARDEWKAWKVNEKTPRPEVIAWSSLPEWLFKKLEKEKGLPWTLAFAESCLKRPQTWYQNLVTGESQLLEGGYRGDEPKGYVQDISNQELVKKVVSVIRERIKNKELPATPRILDLCSAPGGKSLGLAVNGFKVTATDIDENRLQKVIENKTRLDLSSLITVVSYKDVINETEKFDVIWIDAPCLSTGIVRRHPEVKWNRSEKDLPGLVAKQKELVSWAKQHLSENGLLIYSTCSVLKIENDHPHGDRFKLLSQVEWFPQESPYGDAIVASILLSD